MQNNFRPPPPSSPRTQQTAQRPNGSSLLAQFGVRTEHKMDLMNDRTMSPAMKTPTKSPAMRSTPNNSPPSMRTSLKGPIIDLSGRTYEDKSDEDDDVIEYAPRRSARERRSITASQFPASNQNSRRSRKQVSTLLGEDFDLTPTVSNRNAIRQEIANKTVAYRDQFLVDQKDLWLPLLPHHNYVSKLLAHRQNLSPTERTNLPVVTPYQELEKQPKGVKAVMKPYQLSGLSFLLWLHHNGLSGILGDEMGLGKTLQTLSLVQYLKENDPKAGTGRLQRPFLIVCPLSVLSSWMAETKKWTPGLKAIRFHGPVAERQRLKKIVVGEIDHYGNLTAQARSKLKSRRNAAGKTVISLDTDSEEEDVGVDLVVTTYDCFKAEQGWFKTAFVWRYVVLDEGHTVKNDESLISKSLQGIKAEYRLILTGTPLQNNLSELWALLHWLYPEVFSSNTNDLFDKSFNLSKGQYSSTVLDDSRRLLELIMLRRMKTSPGVDLNLPPKTEVLLFVPLTEMQIFWYKRMITKAEQSLLDEIFKDVKVKDEQDTKAMKQIEAQESQLMKIEADALEVLENKALVGSAAWQETKTILEQTVRREQELTNNGDGKKSDWQKLMNLLMQLRKVCNHPYQLPNAEPDPYYTGDHVITASGKFIVLDKLVAELVVKQKKKILVFSGFTKMLDLVEEFLHLRGGDGTSFRSMRIDGQTARARRNLGIRLFNDLNSDYRVMLISTRAGGLGINLASASDVVLLDQDWNPQITLQAEARAHRIGQKNPVTIYKLISQGTVEEQMMGRIQKKLYLSAKVTEAMQDIHTKFGAGAQSRKGNTAEDDSMPQLSTNQLMTLLRRGATAISRPEVDVNEMLSWDWETTVAKCKDNPADMAVKQDAVPDAKIDEEAEQKWLSEMERVEASVFEGKKLAKSARYNTNKQAAQEFFNRADRRIGKNTTVMVDGYAVSKESMDCAWGEAIPTMAGKDPRLAEPVRAKKHEVIPQDYCQVCIDGGDLHCCKLCPRSYHYACLDSTYKSKAKGFSFSCPQHRCFDCDQGTSEAGGMLYRCRWCERAYCEDCLDGDNTILIGNSLMEYELLGYPEMAQAFYIQCGGCTEGFKLSPDNKRLCDDLAEGIRLEYETRFALGSREMSTSTRPSSMTDATTLENSEVNTPIAIDEETELTPSSRKRKARVEIPSSRRSTKKGKLQGQPFAGSGPV